jgi:hypothetical protein
MANSAVAAMVTASALNDGAHSHRIRSSTGAVATWKGVLATGASPRGKPHCGQLFAARETCALHSGQGTRAMGRENTTRQR